MIDREIVSVTGETVYWKQYPGKRQNLLWDVKVEASFATIGNKSQKNQKDQKQALLKTKEKAMRKIRCQVVWDQNTKWPYVCFRGTWEGRKNQSFRKSKNETQKQLKVCLDDFKVFWQRKL